VANIKSQIKRNRQNDKRRLRNRVYRGTARIAVKNARTAIDSGVPESTAALASAISALDKAAEQGVIHRNNAARRKSRLVKAFAKMEPVKVEAQPAMVEPVAEAEPTAKAKKAAPRKRAVKAKAATETKPAPVKKAAATPKKTAAKKKA
jgi:small subunit ribosomal protein S20